MISIREAKNILISVLAISLAITIATSNEKLGVLTHFQTLPIKISFFAITIGIGFVLHELAHKFVAMKFGAFAEFKMWPQGLILSLITSVFGFVFVAPGAVYIYASQITKTQNGLISLAGPLTNLILAFVFLGLEIFFPFKIALSYTPLSLWLFASKINIWLGIFNMIPIFPLDGSKIMDWNIFVWATVGLIFLIMF